MNIPFAVSNSATLRYNLFAGEVNLNDVYTVNPFKDTFYHFALDGTQVQAVVASINAKGASPSSEHTAYFEEGKEIRSTRYYYASVEVVDEGVYDLICAEYDCQRMQSTLEELYPSGDWTPVEYPTAVDSTTAWMIYVAAQMPCSQDCPCPTILG